MLHVTIDESAHTALLEPQGELTLADFEAAVRIIDPYLEDAGKLHGLLIATEHFPGWQSFSALVGHLQFVRDHHNKIAKVAIATDSMLGALAEHVAAHFINAEVKAFSFAQQADAKRWASA